MNPTRLVIVPDETLEPLTLALRTKLTGIAAALTAENVGAALGEQGLRMLDRLANRRPECEVILWGISARSYLAAWTSREPEDEVTLVVSADMELGLVARVGQALHARHTVLHSGPELRAADWTNLEARRGRSLAWMAASAIITFERCVAVVSVHEYRGDHVAGPGADEKTALTEVADLAGRLIEDCLIRATLGLETS